MAMASQMRKQLQIKDRLVNELVNELRKYSVIGLIRVESITSSAMHQLRRDLRDMNARILMAKNSIMERALKIIAQDAQYKGIEKLIDYLKGPQAFLLTDTNPFVIANYFEKRKIPAPAKAGMVAPNDVLVTKRNTGIPPGPAIGELNSVGLKTRIEQGTIAIVQDTVVLKAGEKVSRTLAAVLSRLGIEPFLVGLRVVAAYDDGEVIDGNDLVVDFDAMRDLFMAAEQQAINLSVNAPIYTTHTIDLIVAKAQREALALAIELGVFTEDTASLVLAKAEAHVRSVIAAMVAKDPENVPSDLKELASTPTVSTQAPSASSADEDANEEEDEEEVDEADVGLGNLF